LVEAIDELLDHHIHAEIAGPGSSQGMPGSW
jgi:hypothetical protein